MTNAARIFLPTKVTFGLGRPKQKEKKRLFIPSSHKIEVRTLRIHYTPFHFNSAKYTAHTDFRSDVRPTIGLCGTFTANAKPPATQIIYIYTEKNPKLKHIQIMYNNNNKPVYFTDSKEGF